MVKVEQGLAGLFELIVVCVFVGFDFGLCFVSLVLYGVELAVIFSLYIVINLLPFVVRQNVRQHFVKIFLVFGYHALIEILRFVIRRFFGFLCSFVYRVLYICFGSFVEGIVVVMVGYNFVFQRIYLLEFVF